MGLAKKVLIANTVGELWSNISGAGGSPCLSLPRGLAFWRLLFRYTSIFQYSDMAIGLGKMFGFEFLENFDYPYMSKALPNSGAAGMFHSVPGSETTYISLWEATAKGFETIRNI